MLWDLGPQRATVTFQGGRLVSDAGLLGMRKLDKDLGVLALLAARPSQRSPLSHAARSARRRRRQALGQRFHLGRRDQPAFIILDIDASDDPTHGQQALSF